MISAAEVGKLSDENARSGFDIALKEIEKLIKVRASRGGKMTIISDPSKYKVDLNEVAKALEEAGYKVYCKPELNHLHISW